MFQLVEENSQTVMGESLLFLEMVQLKEKLEQNNVINLMILDQEYFSPIAKFN